MAKKYLSLEEAAEAIGVSSKDLIELREKQAIRGYADRGTWKFKEEDVAEFKRSRQADSNPDVPILGDDSLGEQPTVIRKGGGSALDDINEPSRGRSDSDVRLIVDPDLAPVYEEPAKSDSDVRLIDDSRIGKRRGSDSDVKIVSSVADSDSDVRLAASLADSDSDVRLASSAPGKKSDSDVSLVENPRATKAMTRPRADGPRADGPRTDSDVRVLKKPASPMDTESEVSVVPAFGGPSGKSESVLADDGDMVLDDDSGMTLKAGSGIALEKLADSGISLEAGDSGIMLFSDEDEEPGGSGIHLAGSGIGRGKAKPPSSVDSGLTLAESDEGLVLDEDSGIALAAPGDSGIALSSPVDSGISLEGDAIRDELNATVPMMGRLGGADDDLDATGVELPNLAEEESGYELKMPAPSSGEVADTSVILFDDEDDVGEGATRIRSSREADDEEFGGESFDMDEAGEEVAEFDEDDLDVSEDVVGEDDELDDMDVFDAGDEDFDETFASGESVARPIASQRGGFEAPVQHEWGVGTFIGLFFSTGLLAVCGLVMFDLVRSMWNWNEPGAVTGAIIQQISGMF